MHVHIKGWTLLYYSGRNKYILLQYMTYSVFYITTRRHLIYLYFTSTVARLQNMVNWAQIQISSDLKLHDVEGHSVWAQLFSAAHMTCLWPTVTHSPDSIATMSTGLQWRWRTGRRETIAYLSQADIANLSAIRPSLISAHGTAVSFLLPHGYIRHNTGLDRTLGPN